MNFAFALHTVLLLQCLQSTFGLDNYIQWSPDGVKDLWCSGCYNKTSTVEQFHCCSCEAVPEWELPNNGRLLSLLFVELLNVQGTKSRLISSPIGSSDGKHYFNHTYSKLQKFPTNVCSFRIVIIDVTGNLFTEIEKSSCFTELDTLIMKNNRIIYISNQTFLGMDKLRILDLSYNLITHMDYNAFGGIYILKINLDGNRLHSLDVSNVFFPNKTICGVSYAKNKHVIKITNMGKLLLGQDNTFICGDTDFSYTPVVTHPLLLIAPLDPRTISNFAPCGKGLYHGAAFDCNCDVAEFLNLELSEFYRVYSRKVEEVFCRSPDKLANISIVTVYYNQTLRDLMTCDVQDGCPRNGDCKCKCTSQPSNNVLIVDCSNSSCSDFPEIIPHTKHPLYENYFEWIPSAEKRAILLNMSYNEILDVNTNYYYFEKVKVLDLAKNNLKTLGPNISNLDIATKIVLTSHLLVDLPRTVQLFNPGVFIFGRNGIPCTCENRWIGEWRLYKNASRKYPYALVCSNYDNLLIEDLVDQFEEDCDTNKIPWPWLIVLIVLFCLILLFMALYNCFYHEFLILKTKFRDRENLNRNLWTTDMYISFDDENYEVRYYVLLMLEKFIKRKKMTTYIPCRDSWPGITEEENVLQNMPRCKYVLIIQSNEMYDSNGRRAFIKRMEYNLAWNFYIQRKINKLFILTFDTDKPEKFKFSKSRALFNFGMGFVIHNRKRSLYEKLLEVFSEPLIVNSKHKVQRAMQIKASLWKENIEHKYLGELH